MSMPDEEVPCLAFNSLNPEERRSLDSSAKAASDAPRVTDVSFITVSLPEGDGLAVRVHDYAFRYALDRAFEVFFITKLFSSSGLLMNDTSTKTLGMSQFTRT